MFRLPKLIWAILFGSAIVGQTSCVAVDPKRGNCPSAKSVSEVLSQADRLVASRETICVQGYLHRVPDGDRMMLTASLSINRFPSPTGGNHIPLAERSSLQPIVAWAKHPRYGTEGLAALSVVLEGTLIAKSSCPFNDDEFWKCPANAPAYQPETSSVERIPQEIYSDLGK